MEPCLYSVCQRGNSVSHYSFLKLVAGLEVKFLAVCSLWGTVAKGSGLLLASEVGFCSLYLPQLIHMLLILAEKGSCSVWKFSDSRASWTAGPVVTVSQTASPVSPHFPGLLLFDFEAMSYI